MSDFPISCVLCRRKKIKCNKRKPCNQCAKKGTNCLFPSKFRNIHIGSETGGSSRGWSSSKDSDSYSDDLSREVELLRSEKFAVLHENFQLTQKNHELQSKLATFDRSVNAETHHDRGFEISGETTESGEKFYGPLLSTFMIETLKLNEVTQNLDTQNVPPTSTPKREDDDNVDDVDTLLVKKPLPWLVERNEKHQANVDAITKLVNHFFEISSYRRFISRPSLLLFVEEFDNIPDNEWEHDDDLLLLHMVLILLVQRLTPQEYNVRLSPPVDSVQALNKKTTHLKTVLLRGFTRLRHNLINESIATVQAYILCTEWHFVDQKYEEAWSMLFHCCAVAYAIGLHVMVSMRTTNVSLENAPAKIAELAQDDGGPKVKVPQNDDDDEENGDIPRCQVWFALKHACGQLCSILGRPNPILIQVNLVVLFTSNASVSKLRLDSKNTQVQLKMGLSECIRLSNMMLIESFMMNFTMEDVMRLDSRFKDECDTLSWFVSPEYQNLTSNDGGSDEVTHMPLEVDHESVLIDLVILHINRAKLLEPFLNQFSGPEENRRLLNSLCESILHFLDYTGEFVLSFLERVSPQFAGLDQSTHFRNRLGRVFRTNYPFLNSFLYQGIIVIFTLLNYKAREFILSQSEEFLKLLEYKLNNLLMLPGKFAELLNMDIRFWSTNIIYLITKDLQHINTIFKKREALQRQDLQEEGKQEQGESYVCDQELDNVWGFNLNDPFWFTNPENLPFYLSSPSENGAQLFPQDLGKPSGNLRVSDTSELPSYMGNQGQFLGVWNQQPRQAQLVSTEQSLHFASKRLPYEQQQKSLQFEHQQFQNAPEQFPIEEQFQNREKQLIDQRPFQSHFQNAQFQNNHIQYTVPQFQPLPLQVPMQPHEQHQFRPTQQYSQMAPKVENSEYPKPASELSYAQSESKQREYYTAAPPHPEFQG